MEDTRRTQLLKSALRTFYLHKSFDIQSDLEFLPAIPSDTHSISVNSSTVSSTVATPETMHVMSPKQVVSPIMTQNSMYGYKSNGGIQYNQQPTPNKEFFHNSTPLISQQLNDLLQTPKARMLYLNSQEKSPKHSSVYANTNTNSNPLRRRFASNGQNQISIDQMYANSKAQQMNQNRLSSFDRGYWMR
ncbi:hypothetical protein HYPBUDRAFT_12037 [Hyphopichia burtonii NRRL Y-1933]|uniref:Uncharacterized protein n=1 Tax=Hyphopichia burtonii NRRL Y-1933 TaxID=984485 RepID=A0A1E4RGF0_9ASCO|nr:hypothetical protein HYPBUDRAFT_12037 [Hyphopichia burtonii NRRL Y-1933]ODV66328.1 hypothetical protein HYPBUDRAFT_12037 [Hyphopichia burtonii NRRL Y-1933]